MNLTFAARAASPKISPWHQPQTEEWLNLVSHIDRRSIAPLAPESESVAILLTALPE